MGGRTDVHDVMAIKRNFLASMGYHIFLTMVLVIENRESDLFNRITSDTGHVFYDLFPPKRNGPL